MTHRQGLLSPFSTFFSPFTFFSVMAPVRQHGSDCAVFFFFLFYSFCCSLSPSHDEAREKGAIQRPQRSLCLLSPFSFFSISFFSTFLFFSSVLMRHDSYAVGAAARVQRGLLSSSSFFFFFLFFPPSPAIFPSPSVTSEIEERRVSSFLFFSLFFFSPLPLRCYGEIGSSNSGGSSRCRAAFSLFSTFPLPSQS